MARDARLIELAARLATQFNTMNAEITRVMQKVQAAVVNPPPAPVYFLTSDGQELLTADGQQFRPAGA